tara:strand:+ start:8713 stop:9657 length:945 start_codon:yes stop_codon:yes gene_type:complete
MDFNNKQIFLLGPTATGKTELIKDLYKFFPIEIISVDSAQIYKGLDIGTAKLNKRELEETPHHLIDIRLPIETYSVGDFKKDVDLITKEALKKQKIPFLCGGTMMYFNSLENPINNLPVSTKRTRKDVNDELKKNGIDFLYTKLKKIDPIFSKKIHAKDTQRIQRGLEVYYISGRPLSSFYKQNLQKNISHNLLKIALWPKDRKKLHDIIEARVTLMLKNGLIDEVEKILNIYPNIDDSYPSIRSVGYRQTYWYIKNLISKKELKDRLIFATRQLAKRQITWMKKMNNLEIFDPFDKPLSKDVCERIEKFLIKK